MNVELLKKVKAAILAEPRQFVMSTWFTRLDPNIPNCGTAACIAGWALAIAWRETPATARHRTDHRDFEVDIAARHVLGLNECEASDLFFTLSWPNQFRHAWEAVTDNPEKRARVAADYIDYVIKKYEDEQRAIAEG